MSMQFQNRADAGRRLAAKLASMGLERPVVLALPRGGVPVAAEVAQALKAPLDLLLVRKIGAPTQPELAMAAVADGGAPALEIDDAALVASGVTREYILRQVPQHLQEIERRRRVYLAGAQPLDLHDCTAVLVDDGIATGTTVRAALQALHVRQPGRIVLAVPVAPAAEVARLRPLVDDLVCLHAPPVFSAVGRYYADFAQLGDDDVLALMQACRPVRAAAPPG